MPSCVDDVEADAEVDAAGARRALDRCLACPSVSPAAFLLAADLDSSLGDDSSARRTLRDATLRFPSNSALWEARARYELSAGTATAAVDAMRTALRLRPEDPRLAAAYRTLLARHGSAADRAATRVDALITEASGRYDLGDSPGAEATLREAESAAAGFADLLAKVYFRRGLLAVAEGRFDAGQRHLDHALETVRHDSELRADIDLARAELALTVGDYAGAERAAARVVAARPSRPLGYVDLALARVYLGDRAAAVEALERAMKLGIAGLLTREQAVSLLGSAPWGPFRPEVDALILRAWGGR